MPVGHAVIATIDGLSEAAGAVSVVAVGVTAAGAAVADAAAAAGAAVFLGAGVIAPSTSSTMRSGVSAERRSATKSGRTRARASALSSFMCSLPPPAGAAMRKTMSAGPSGAPKSTLGASRAIARLASVTDSARACGMAMPPGNPVADLASRARAASTRSEASVVRPASPSAPARKPITAGGSAPASTSSRTVSTVMICCAMGSSFFGVPLRKGSVSGSGSVR